MRQEVLLTKILSYKVHHLTEDNLKDEEKEIKTVHHHRFFFDYCTIQTRCLISEVLAPWGSYVNEKHVRVCVLLSSSE